MTAGVHTGATQERERETEQPCARGTREESSERDGTNGPLALPTETEAWCRAVEGLLVGRREVKHAERQPTDREESGSEQEGENDSRRSCVSSVTDSEKRKKSVGRLAAKEEKQRQRGRREEEREEKGNRGGNRWRKRRRPVDGTRGEVGKGGRRCYRPAGKNKEK